MSIPFTKMHGLGNDFAVIDATRRSFDFTPEQIRQMADRHFGIGFDQLLVVTAPSQPEVDFNFRIFNADGSEVDQCGNGARCVGRFVADAGLTDKKIIQLATASARLEVHLEDNNQVKVNMGIPILDPKQIPFIAERQALSYSLQVNDQTVEIGAVSMGNPHAVLKVSDVDTAPVSTWGPVIEQHPNFPKKVNVGFMEVVDRRHIRLRVYERGAGETLACGSGACAAVVVGQLQALLDAPVTVDLAGGRLTIQWQGPGHPVWMSGPTQTVYTGEWLNQ